MTLEIKPKKKEGDINEYINQLQEKCNLNIILTIDDDLKILKFIKNVTDNKVYILQLIEQYDNIIDLFLSLLKQSANKKVEKPDIIIELIYIIKNISLLIPSTFNINILIDILLIYNDIYIIVFTIIEILSHISFEDVDVTILSSSLFMKCYIKLSNNIKQYHSKLPLCIYIIQFFINILSYLIYIDNKELIKLILDQSNLINNVIDSFIRNYHRELKLLKSKAIKYNQMKINLNDYLHELINLIANLSIINPEIMLLLNKSAKIFIYLLKKKKSN